MGAYVSRRVGRPIKTLEVILYHEGTSTKDRIKAASVMQQCVRTHMKLIESEELERRVERLEMLNGHAPN